jgi:hypothetical protein
LLDFSHGFVLPYSPNKLAISRRINYSGWTRKKAGECRKWEIERAVPTAIESRMDANEKLARGDPRHTRIERLVKVRNEAAPRGMGGLCSKVASWTKWRDYLGKLPTLTQPVSADWSAPTEGESQTPVVIGICPASNSRR